MEEYAIYLRKSRQDLEAEAHGAGETLKRHETALLALAQGRRYPIGRVYREVVSGDTIAGRPEMQALLADVGLGRWKGVLVMEESRLARGDTMDQGRVQQAFYYSHTLIITPNKIFDPDNEADQEYFEFGLFMSRREYKTINRRLNRGRLESAKEGKWGGGHCPYGYCKVKLSQEKGYALEPVPQQAQIVRSMADWYLQDDLSAHEIAARLNAAGLQTARQRPWTPASVYAVLENPVYCGLVRYGYRKTDRHPDGSVHHYKTTEELGVNLFPGRHQAILSREEHEAILRKHPSKPGKPGPSRSPLQNPFAGLCYCACCGRAMVRSLGRHGEARLWCRGYGCTTGTVSLNKVEGLVLQSLRVRLAGLELPKTGPERSHGEEAVLSLGMDKIQTELLTLSDQIARAFELVEQNVYTPEVFSQRMDVLEHRKRELEGRLALLRGRLDALNAPSCPPEPRREMPETVPALYSTLGTAQEKHNLLAEVLSAVILYHPVGTRELSLKLYYRL